MLDYAVSPDGSSFVVGDGRRLVMVDADGSNRRVLTEEGFLEFDPTYAPNGQRLAFARADATTGSGMGIWERTDPRRSDADRDPGGRDRRRRHRSHPAMSGAAPEWLRAPRYAPDGEALAFVDATGVVGHRGADHRRP